MNKKIEIETTENVFSFSVDTKKNLLKLYNLINASQAITKVYMDEEESMINPTTQDIMEMYENKYL